MTMRQPRSWKWGTALLVAVTIVGCDSKSEVERQREAAADAAEREVSSSPLAGLKRSASLTVADREAWRPILKWPVACEDAFQTSHAGDDGGLGFHALAPGLWTVDVVCAAGSYQPSHVFLRLDERGSSPVTEMLRFPVYRTDDGIRVVQLVETEIAGEVAFSTDGRELSVLSLSRQIGDCGIWSRFRISGTHPAMIDAAARLPCPSEPGAPAAWINGNAPDLWVRIRTSG